MLDHREARLTLTRAELVELVRSVVDEALRNPITMSFIPGVEDPIRTGPLTVVPGSYEAHVNGLPIRLKPREFSVLRALARNLGCVLSRQQLIDLAWPDPESVDSERTVDTHVARLRRALGDAGQLITSVIGVGYRLVDAPGEPTH